MEGLTDRSNGARRGLRAAKKKKGAEKVMTDEDLAFKQKQKEEQKKLAEAKAKMGGKGKGK